MYCPKCGEDIPDDARFCTKCGHQIDSSKEEGPTDAELWLSKAKALKEEGIAKDDKRKIEESLAAFDKAIELDPKSGVLWYEKGVAL
ncbi:MAG: zinc-ribbon domain-containing protein, partial [Candidatus Hydrothermarchaeales archaeon]